MKLTRAQELELASIWNALFHAINITHTGDTSVEEIKSIEEILWGFKMSARRILDDTAMSTNPHEVRDFMSVIQNAVYQGVPPPPEMPKSRDMHDRYVIMPQLEWSVRRILETFDTYWVSAQRARLTLVPTEENTPDTVVENKTEKTPVISSRTFLESRHARREQGKIAMENLATEVANNAPTKDILNQSILLATSQISEIDEILIRAVNMLQETKTLTPNDTYRITRLQTELLDVKKKRGVVLGNWEQLTKFKKNLGTPDYSGRNFFEMLGKILIDFLVASEKRGIWIEERLSRAPIARPDIPEIEAPVLQKPGTHYNDHAELGSFTTTNLRASA